MLAALVEGWRHPSHNCYWATSLVVVLLLLQCGGANSKFKCGPGSSSIGVTVPEGDIILEYGSSLEIFCHMDLSHTEAGGHNASHLRFYRNGKQVEKEFIEVLNSTTIRLFKKDPPPSKDTYNCLLQTSSSTMGVCINQVYIGYKPQEVLNFTCISSNWQNLTCRWTKPENPVETKYTLRFHLPGRAGARMPFKCPNSSKQTELREKIKRNEGLCFWGEQTMPQYRHPYQYYYFSMVGENPLGQVSFSSMKFHHYGHVIPSSPEKLVRVNKTTHSVLLQWVLPYPMSNFPPGVTHHLEYQSSWDDRDTWHLANTSVLDVSKQSDHTYNLTGLTYANTVYDIRVYIKSAVAVGDDKWSKPATITVKTEPAIPGAAPKTDLGSFEVLGGVPARDVYVYWQHIADYLKNGEEFQYQVISVKENGVEQPNVTLIEMTNAYAKFKGLTFNDYHFTIVAANAMGISETRSVVYVPNKNNMPPEPVSFTKIAFGPGLYELSWNLPLEKINQIDSYTIFWCRNERDRPYQCTGFLNWTRVQNNVSMINITVPDDKIYQFAISTNTKVASSGMVWASCTVIHNKVVGKMKSVWINRIGSYFIEVGWKLECSDRIGRVEGFLIEFCPIVSPYNVTCKEPKQTKKLDPVEKQIHGNITGLRPYTTYMVSIAVLTHIGTGQQSDPLLNTTLEAAPDAPRNVSVSSVANTSMVVKWLPPLSRNGMIRYYKVYYNNSFVRVESNTTVPDSNISVTLGNLTSYVNYSINVSACTIECSEPSQSIWVKTDIGAPGKMDQPVVKLVNSSQVLVSWKPPHYQGGTLNYYEVAVQQSDENKNLSHYYRSRGIEKQISIPDCDAEGFRHQKYSFMVRAVNIGQLNQTYTGLWSEPGEGSCYNSGPSKAVRTAIWVFGFILISALIMVLVYAGKRVWLRCKEMQDLVPKLPPGLAPTFEKEKDPDYHIDVAWPPHIHDHHLTGKLLLDQNEDHHAHNPSGDSSGCSSGHESVSSSLTSGTQISSDSGTEVDQHPPSPDGIFVNTAPWDRTSLRQRNVGSLRPDGDPYVKMGKGSGSGSVARSTPNLTDMDNLGTVAAGTAYSCLGAWSLAGYGSMPSSEEMENFCGGEGTGYCRVGLDSTPTQGAVSLQQGQQQAQMSPPKGYVILSSISASTPQLQQQQPESAPQPQPQSQARGYVSHHLPWSNPIAAPKASQAGKGYVMAGELGVLGHNKSIPASPVVVDVEEEDHGFLDLESLDGDDESYSRFGLPLQTSEETVDQECGASKPSSGYVTLGDSPRPPDVAGTGGTNVVSSGPRAGGTSGGYVPHKHFEKRDTALLGSDMLPDHTTDSYTNMVSTSAGDTNVNSPTANV